MIVWLASYPRSGNTLLRIILNHVFGIESYSKYNDKLDIADDKETATVVGHRTLPESLSIEDARASNETFFIKTHEIESDLNDKSIYVIRDGRDSIVSYYHYLKSYVDPHTSISDVILGKVLFGTWGNHVSGWSPQARHRCLLLRYEDLAFKREESVRSISKFVDIPPSDASVPTFNDLQKINPKFFRSGQTATWQKDLTGDDLRAFWLLNCQEMMKYFQSTDSPWIEIDGSDNKEQGSFFKQYGQSISEHISKQEEEKAKQAFIAASTQDQLDFTRSRLTQIMEITASLIQTKALKHPFKKYHLYKQLLAQISNTSNKLDN